MAISPVDEPTSAAGSTDKEPRAMSDCTASSSFCGNLAAELVDPCIAEGVVLLAFVAACRLVNCAGLVTIDCEAIAIATRSRQRLHENQWAKTIGQRIADSG